MLKNKGFFSFFRKQKENQNNRISYENFPGFEEIYLEDSYIKGINAPNKKFIIRMDFVLCERHPLYSHPKPNEQYCYRNGIIEFSHFSRVRWTTKDKWNISPAMDADNELDFGNIDSFWKEGNNYHINGGLGDIMIKGGEVRIQLDE